MDESESIRLMIINAVNECTDSDLLDLIYKLLVYETNNGGESTPAVIFVK